MSPNHRNQQIKGSIFNLRGQTTDFLFYFQECVCTWVFLLPVWWTVAPVLWSWASRSLFPIQRSVLVWAGSQCRSSTLDSASAPSYTPLPLYSACAWADQSAKKHQRQHLPLSAAHSVLSKCLHLYLKLEVPAPHHCHVLLLAQSGVPHGQFVVLVLHSQQFVAVGISFLFEFIEPWGTLQRFTGQG